MRSTMKPDVLAAPWPVALLATALAYAATGLMAMLLAIPPGYATPMFPAAGVALVSVLLRGPRMLPAVWLGSVIVNVTMAPRGLDGLDALMLPATIGVGALLQAWIASGLVRRRIGAQPCLDEPREVLRFFAFGAVLGCMVSPTVAVIAMRLTDTIGPALIGRVWLTWWLGDALGTIIFAPILLTLVGSPRRLWRLRRRSVALPLLVVTVLASIAIAHARRWDDSRALALFERDLASVHSAVQLRLHQPLHALEAMRGLLGASDEVTAEEFRAAAMPWHAMDGAPQGLGASRQLELADVPAFEARRQRVTPSYRVFDRLADGTRPPTRAETPIAIRYVEPIEHNSGALGLNSASVTAAREALERSRRAGAPAATAGFRLTQESGDQTGVVIYDWVRLPDGSAGRDVAFVTLRMQDVLEPAIADLPDDLHVCLVDLDGDRRVLAGRGDCAGIARLQSHRAIDLPFAQRHWALEVGTSGSAGAASHLDTWLFAIISLLAVATFGSLLLITTGRTLRIEAAVDERTVELQHEIGERIRTEAALRDSEQRFRNILNHVPIGVLYTDLKGHIKQANPKLRELLGLSAEQLDRMRSWDFVHPDDAPEDRLQIERLIAGDISVWQRQERMLRADGRVLWVRTSVSLLRDAQGHPHRIVGTVEDITEHLQLEEAQAGRELAEAANRAKNDFLSRMSHELRTPLNAMLGFAQLIELDRQQPLSTSQKDWVGQIQTAGWHLLEMINDTLDLSRIESGTLKLSCEVLDLRSVIEGTMSMVERDMKARRIGARLEIAPEAAQVAGDPTRIKQILTNLLTNAVKYNVDDGSIEVTARPNLDGEIEISVADTGLGMNEAQQANLFQPFNRLGRERSSQQGTGIGLVISKRLAELMGGRLTCTSAEGLGSAFTVTLPRAMPRDADPDHQDELTPNSDYHHRIVHYIEDNETNAVVMEGILAQRPQVRLRVSSTGLEGLNAVRQRPPSLILLDMHLPDIDGQQLLRLLKDDLVTATIPVVAVSADAVANRIQGALDIGAEYYLTKPLNVPELLRIVDELLESRDTLFG